MPLIQRLRTTTLPQGDGLLPHRLRRWRVGRYLVTLQRDWHRSLWAPACLRGQRGRDGWLWSLVWRGWLLFVWPWSDRIDH